jgi:hypothetical protein
LTRVVAHREQLLNEIERQDDEGIEVVAKLGSSLVALLKANHTNTRVIIPALKTIEFLLESMIGLETLAPPDHPFTIELIQLIRAEVRAAPKDIHLVLAVLGPLAASLTFEQPARGDALALLMLLLCHRYPKIRLVTAETLFTALNSVADEIGSAAPQSICAYRPPW